MRGWAGEERSQYGRAQQRVVIAERRRHCKTSKVKACQGREKTVRYGTTKCDNDGSA